VTVSAAAAVVAGAMPRVMAAMVTTATMVAPPCDAMRTRVAGGRGGPARASDGGGRRRRGEQRSERGRDHEQDCEHASHASRIGSLALAF
jgi:hypothetical protein